MTASTIAKLTEAADQAWDRAARHTATHTNCRHVLAAALLRQRWPAAASITADMAGLLAGDGDPWLSAIHDTAGVVLTQIDQYDNLIDAVAEQLAKAFDFADSPEAAGWTRVPTSGRGVFDPILYTLTLPEPES